MLTRFATFEVHSIPSGKHESETGETIPGGYNTAKFITAITPIAGPTGYKLPSDIPVVPPPIATATTFQDVTAGTRISYNITAKNDFVEQTLKPQFFRMTISLSAETCTRRDHPCASVAHGSADLGSLW
jgi:hypothetical protein